MFKVRDWVVCRDYAGNEEFRQYEDELNDIFKSVKLWQPKEGEWCWFWNKGATKPTIGQFENKHTKSTYNMKNSMYFYDYCEPFIGTLPSFLKN